MKVISKVLNSKFVNKWIRTKTDNWHSQNKITFSEMLFWLYIEKFMSFSFEIRMEIWLQFLKVVFFMSFLFEMRKKLLEKCCEYPKLIFDRPTVCDNKQKLLILLSYISLVWYTVVDLFCILPSQPKDTSHLHTPPV